MSALFNLCACVFTNRASRRLRSRSCRGLARYDHASNHTCPPGAESTFISSPIKLQKLSLKSPDETQNRGSFNRVVNVNWRVPKKYVGTWQVRLRRPFLGEEKRKELSHTQSSSRRRAVGCRISSSLPRPALLIRQRSALNVAI